MSFLQRKITGTQKLYRGLVGQKAEIAAVKYAIKQLDSRLSAALKVKDYPNLFYFYGPPGAGKTTLLRTICEDCQRGELGFEPLVAWFDCDLIARSEAIAEESLMIGLAKSLISAQEELFPVFQGLLEFWHRYSCEEPKSTLPPTASQANISAPAAPTHQTLRKAGPASPPQVLRTAAPTRVNPVKSAYGSMANIEIKKRADGSQSVQHLARSVNKNIQAMEAAKKTPPPLPTIDTKVEILHQFVKIIDELSRTYRIVFFLDNYENFERQDDWFRNQFIMAFQNELIFVMAGESNLHKVYQTQLGNTVNCISLPPFDVFDTEMYFMQQNGIRDPKIVVSTQRLTEGNPLAVSIVSSAMQHLVKKSTTEIMEFLEFPDEEYGDKMNKYLAYIMMDEIPPVDQNLIAVLAIMREFDMHLFQNLSGAMNVKRTLDALSKRYPFVSPFGEMSPFMKQTLRGYIKQELEHLYTDLHQGAYEHFAELVREDPENYELLLDSLYYYFHVDPHSAYNHFVHVISHFLHSNLDFLDRLCIEILKCALPRDWKNSIRQLARSLGSYRKKDPNGSQVVLSAISNVEPIQKEEMQFLQF